MHVDAVHFVGGGAVVAGGLVIESMVPVLLHAGDALGQDQVAGVGLGVAADRSVPVVSHEGFAALLAEPLEAPLVVAAEVVAA